MRFLTCILLLLTSSYNLFSQKVITLDNSFTSIRMGNKMEIFEDPSCQITIENILTPSIQSQFKPSTEEIPNFGFTSSSYWFRFQVEDYSPEDFNWLFEAEFPLMDTVNLYVLKGDQVVIEKSSGDLIPFDRRDIMHKSILFTLPLRKGDRYTVYVQSTGNFSKRFPFNLITEKKFIEKTHLQDAFKGIYYGIILVIILYNFFLFLSIKDRTYLYYVLGISGSMFIAPIFLDGYGYELISRGLPQFANVASILFSTIAIPFNNRFTKSFLNTRALVPKLHFGLGIFDVVGFTLGGLTFISIFNTGMFLFVSQSSIWLFFTSSVTWLVTGILVLRKKYRPARFYMFSFGILLFFTILFSLMVAGILAENFITGNSIAIGSAAQAVLLSFALADRFRIAEEDKREAQNEAIAALEEKEELIANQNERLEVEVKERTRELQESYTEINTQKEEISAQRDVLEEQSKALAEALQEINKKNENILSSINYAKRIQQAILPEGGTVDREFEEFMVLYKPRDIVSGDFYWFSQKNGKLILIAADCTGHGVPGALMSMIGNEILNEIVNLRGITAADEILNELHLSVRSTLRQKDSNSRDGMDVSLVVIDKEAGIMEYAGAKNPLIYVQNENLYQIKGDKFPIGGIQKEQVRKFKRHAIDISDPTIVYLFTDGYIDQFGGNQNKKFLIKNLRDMIEEVHYQPMEQQYEIFEDKLINWMNGHRQIDDILVMGVKI